MPGQEGPSKCQLHYCHPELASQETRTLAVVPSLGSVPSGVIFKAGSQRAFSTAWCLLAYHPNSVPNLRFLPGHPTRHACSLLASGPISCSSGPPWNMGPPGAGGLLCVPERLQGKDSLCLTVPGWSQMEGYSAVFPRTPNPRSFLGGTERYSQLPEPSFRAVTSKGTVSSVALLQSPLLCSLTPQSWAAVWGGHCWASGVRG